jgi:4-hydroxy-tetrahydrodipicolinate synthase
VSLRGIWAAVLTPIDSRLEPNAGRAIEYYGALLREGCDGLNVLGTTGEAASLGLRQRTAFIEALAASELPLERVMIGTGATSLEDTTILTQTASRCGFAAALILPPFFYRDASDDGVVDFFDRLFTRIEPKPRSVVLYNFPKMSGVTFRPNVVQALTEEFPSVIAGVKDSSNDRAFQRELIARHEGLAVFPGSEEYLLEASDYGAAGCISGSVALWAQLAATVFAKRDPAQATRLAELRRAIEGPNLLLRVRYLTARLRADPVWERAMPPLGALDSSEKRLLDEIIRFV